MNADWERGYNAGFDAGYDAGRRFGQLAFGNPPDKPTVASPVSKAKKPKRKASAYSKRYGQMFRRVAPKYKLKSGAWAKDGFKRAQKAAHRLAKK